MSTEGTSENDTSEVKESEVAEQQKETASQQDVEQAQKDVEQTELQSEPDEAESDMRETAENSETDELENSELKEAPADEEAEAPESESEDQVYDMELQQEPEMTEEIPEESTPAEAGTEPDESAETESAADDEAEPVEEDSADNEEAEPTEDVSAADMEEAPAESAETEPVDTNESVEAETESGAEELPTENAETEAEVVEPENIAEPSETTDESENAPAETAEDTAETKTTDQAEVTAEEETENTETPVENAEKTEPEAETETTPEESTETETDAVDETAPVEPTEAEAEAVPVEGETVQETDETAADDADVPAENAEAKTESVEGENEPAEDGEDAAEQTETETIPDAEPFTVEENGETAESDSTPENASESAEGNDAADVESIPEAEPFTVEEPAEGNEAADVESIPEAEPFTVEESAESAEGNDMPDIPENYEEFSVEDMPISEETRENLKDFEQENWDNLSQVEKEEAVEKLRDSIAEDLQLENKPEVTYYNHEDAGDFGGYAASNNTIYINRYTMGDAAETADTVAHESRHCWQHERAENPQTEQDYALKKNLEHYISPDENFEAYQNQMVERDARAYAGEVTRQIPEAEEETDESPMLKPEIDDEDAEHEDTRGPPTEVSESKTVDVLPEDFEAKYETQLSELEQKQVDICKKFYEENKDEGTYHELNSIEKQELSKQLFEALKSASYEEQGNCRAPIPEKIKGVNSEGHLVEAWKPNTDGAVDGTRHMEIPRKGQIIDRVGGEGGNYFSPLGPDGKPEPIERRATGDLMPHKNIEENASYHSYNVLVDFTRENFRSQIDNSNFESNDKNRLIDILDSYYEDCADSSMNKNQHPGEAYIKDNINTDGVKTGTIAPMFGLNDGGATQYITPFSVSKLRDLGMLNEIPRRM